MKTIIFIYCALLLTITACKKDDEGEFSSYILAVEKDSFGFANLSIEAVVIGPRIDIDSFYLHITQFVPYQVTTYRYDGTTNAGKYYFHIENLTQGTSYEYYLFAKSWDGKHYRHVESPRKTGTTQGSAP